MSSEWSASVLCSFVFSKNFTTSRYDSLGAGKSVKVKIHFNSYHHIQDKEQAS